MEKEILVKIQGSEIEQSAVYGGVQGEAGARLLKISFDGEWRSYSKSVTFFDCNMENPVKIILSSVQANDDGSYSVPIPSEAVKEGGCFTYIVDGYTLNGSTSKEIQRSVSKSLKVKYAPDTSSASNPSSVTAAIAEQLQAAIDAEAARIDKQAESIAEIEEKNNEQDEGIDALEERADIFADKIKEQDEGIDALEERADIFADKIKELEEKDVDLSEALAMQAEKYTALNKKDAELEEKDEELLSKINETSGKIPQVANTMQAVEGTCDTVYLTPLKGKQQFDKLIAERLVNTPEVYTKEDTDGMAAITGMKDGDFCVILRSETSAQSIYRYYTKAIDGSDLSSPAWIWQTDLSLFAPRPVLQLANGATNSSDFSGFSWDFSLGHAARLTLYAIVFDPLSLDDEADESGADVPSVQTIMMSNELVITNVQSGDVGILDVYNADKAELQLPSNSYELPPDWDYLTPSQGQHYRYTFFYDGSKFDWSRSVRNNE